MIQRINHNSFEQAFENYGREDSFSRAGLRALFDHLEENDPETELDVIELCSIYSEYDTAAEAAEDFGFDLPEPEDGETPDETEDRREEEARKWLDRRTTTIDVDGGGIIVADF